MIPFRLSSRPDRPFRILALGAHADDIEIGAGGSVLRLVRERTDVDVRWVVFAASGKRGDEARASATEFLSGATQTKVDLHEFRDGYFPDQWAGIKDEFEKLKAAFEPDIVLTHRPDDKHQDHRVIGELSWNTWRDHAILEYEIPKYDGDLGRPNTFIPLDRETARRKVDALMRHYPSQAGRPWFTAETFLGLMRLRAVEVQCADEFAEAFHARKVVLSPGDGR